MPRNYYDTLAAERLRLCYELVPPAVREYLRAEIAYILQVVRPGARVLELGCGYGRVLSALAPTGVRLYGIDISLASLLLASSRLSGVRAPRGLLQADALALPFLPAAFDLVFCPQNGISAFHVDQRRLVLAAINVAAPGGRVLFFSYADEFWSHRLEWFRIQAEHGLIGPIDEASTGNGTIVCRDGFTATTVTPAGFVELTRDLGGRASVSVLDGASVVCDISV
jgi:2-polyprenyl-6-hydroxyphenyl methylase/3-demethylubiquinone-9 3-methyltransferase